MFHFSYKRVCHLCHIIFIVLNSIDYTKKSHQRLNYTDELYINENAPQGNSISV